MCYWEVIQARPKMQSVRWQSKQTHGWKHTEIKKPKLDFSPHGPTLEVDASENLWDIVFSLLLPFSSQRKSCLQLIKTMSKEGRNSYNTVLSFSSVRELARNGKHEPQPSRKYRPEHMKVTMKEMYLTGIQETRGFTLPLYDILALKNCSTNNEDYYVNSTELCTSHEIKLYPSQKHANHLFHTPDTSLSPSSLNIHRLQLHDQLLQQLTLSWPWTTLHSVTFYRKLRIYIHFVLLTALNIEGMNGNNSTTACLEMILQSWKAFQLHWGLPLELEKKQGKNVESSKAANSTVTVETSL